MPAERAVKAYKINKMNCAQSVLDAFRACRGVTDDAITEAKAFGSGKAEGGRCGAFHAGILLANNTQTTEILHSTFSEKAGSVRCREIRALKQMSCEDCIRMAAEIIAEHECREHRLTTG